LHAFLNDKVSVANQFEDRIVSVSKFWKWFFVSQQQGNAVWNDDMSRQTGRIGRRRTLSRAICRIGFESFEPRRVLDSDDQFSEAIQLGAMTTSAVTRSDAIAEDVDVDLYSFSVSAGQVVDFDIDTPLNGPGGLGSYIRLFNTQGLQIDFNNDGAAPGENSVNFDSYLRYTFASAGTFYLGVSNYNNTSYNPVTGNGDTTGGSYSTGTYSLIVRGLPVDPDDSISEAIVLGNVTTTASTSTNTIDPDIDVDIYRFNVTAGQVVDFDIDTQLNGPGGLGSYIRLFNAQGTQLAFNNDGAASGESLGFDSYLRYNFAISGTYYLGVSNYNNILYNPTNGNGDTAGGQYSIGDYALIVQAVVSNTNDPDDAIGEAIALGAMTTTAVTRSDSVSIDIDVDMYSLSATAGQVIDFDIDTTQNGTGGLGSYIRLFNAQGTQLDFNDDGSAPGENSIGFDAYLRYAFTTTGTYYLAVSNFNNVAYSATTGEGDTAGGLHATGNYQLSVQALPVDTDDAISEANSLGVISTSPSTTSAAITPDIDVDMYSFTVAAGQIVSFDIDTTQNGPGGLGSYIRLFNIAGTQLAFNNDAAAPGETLGFDAYLQYTFATAGTYYLGVSNLNNILYSAVNGTGDTAGGFHSIGAYQLSVQAVVTNAPDTDDALSEAQLLGAISTTAAIVNDIISPDTDVDMYRFTVTAGQVVDFDIDTVLNGSGGVGSYIRLFDAQGTQLDANDDGAAPGENTVGYDAYLRFTFVTAGTYYLGVSNNNNISYDAVTGNGDTSGGLNTTGSYRLTVQSLPVDSDDSTPEAISLGAVTTSTITSSNSIDPDIDVDIFSFSVTAGQVVDFDIDTVLNGPGGLGSYIRLFNSQGVQLAFNNDAAAPGETVGFDAYLRYTFTIAGTYYLGVSNFNNVLYNPLNGNGDTAGGPHSIGAYQLVVQAVVTDTNDPDDAMSEATVLGPITTTANTSSKSISPDTDVDMFRFSVTAGQVVDFDIDTNLNGAGGLGSYIRLFNSQGTQLDFSDDDAAPGENVVGFDAYLRYTFTTAGTYFLGVSNYNNVTYSATTGNGDTSGGANATGDYQLIIQALPVDPDDAISEATTLGAITFSPITTPASITPDIDVDMYRFTVAAGQVVDFDIDTIQNGPGGLGSYIRLFNSLGAELAFNDDAAAPGETAGFDAYLRYTFATAGTYYLGVSNYNNVLYTPLNGNNDTAGGLHAIGDYQLTLQAIPTTVNDVDDAISEAIILGTVSTTATTTGNTISSDTDVDMYAFTVAANQVVDFDIDTTLNGQGGLGSYIRLFDSQGLQLDSNDDGAAPGENVVGFDAYLRHAFNAAGTYYLGVSNFNNVTYSAVTGDGDTAGGLHSTGSYQLIVQGLPVDIDDELTEATSLGAVSTTLNTTAAAITPDIDVDMYRFTVTAGQVVDFDVDTTQNGPGGLGSYIRLFNSQGTQIAENNDAAAPGESLGFDAYLRFTFATAGTFYLGVSNSNNVLYNPVNGNGDTAGGLHSIGNYQLIVREVVTELNDADDTISEAIALGSITTTPTITSNSISPAIDVDMFAFTVTAGQVVDFDIDTTQNGSGGLGSFLRLFDALGNQLDFNDDGAAPGENAIGIDAYLRHTFSNAGTFYLGVSNSNNIAYNAVTGEGDTAGGLNSLGSYQLVVQSLPIDPDDATSEATILGPITSTPVTTSASIAPDIDVDMYRFTVIAGQVVDFDIDTTQNGTGGLGSYIRLFNVQGTQLASNDDAAAPGESVGFDAYLRYTFVTSGTYYLGVSNSNNVLYNSVNGNDDTAGGFNSIGAYRLIIQEAVPEVGDTDDAISEAIALGAVTTTPLISNNTISPDTDVDMYAINVTTGQVVDFDIDTPFNGPGGLGSYIQLFNAQGSQLDVNDNGSAPGENSLGIDAYLRFTFPTAGTYYVGISNSTNVSYSPLTGNGDTAGGANSIGAYQLVIQALPTDLDDAISEGITLGSISTTAAVRAGGITPDIDVDMYSFTVIAGQIVDFDVDTTLNGPGGLGSYIRLFSSAGTQLDFNDNAPAPGETLGFDAYLRYTFTTAGTYHLGVSNSNNIAYNATNGSKDTAGGFHSIGDYQLTVQTPAAAAKSLTVSITPTSIPEINGVAVGTVARNNADQSQPLTVTLTSSDPSAATVDASVVIPANQPSVTFQVLAVHDVARGTTTVSITAAAAEFVSGSQMITITDSDLTWHNANVPTDVNDDNRVSPIDALLVINYLNANGSGGLPSGSPPPYLDVSGDNQITPLDALLVINYLNQFGSGEGEASYTDTPVDSPAALVDSAFAVYELMGFDDSISTESHQARKRLSRR
jgi:Dockerin type I domain/Bacterial pre-peptidase C-terminal domain